LTKQVLNYRVGIAKKSSQMEKEIFLNKRGVFEENMELNIKNCH
jgi:hypothetical protein